MTETEIREQLWTCLTMKGRDEASEWYEVVRAGEILVWVCTDMIAIGFLFRSDLRQIFVFVGSGRHIVYGLRRR